MKALCNLTTKKIEGFSRWDDFEFDPDTHVVIDVTEMPDMKLDRLNNTNDGLRPTNQGEITADLNGRKEAQVDAEFTPALIALERARDPINADATIAAAKALRKQEL